MQKKISLFLSTLCVLSTPSLYAGSFSLYNEGNGTAVGNFGAGLPAEAADASTGWYNPAGLSLLHDRQAVIGGVAVYPTVRLTGVNTVSSPPLPNYVQPFSKLSMEEQALLPSIHVALPLGESVTAGLSIVSPFGLRTRWRENSPVRYGATVSELKTMNISPEIGGRFMDNLALGLGVDIQYASVKFNRVLGAPTILQALQLSPYAVDSISFNKGDSVALGFHAGVMAFFNDNRSRVGLNYQSRMSHKFNGYSKLSGPLAQPGFGFNPLSLAQLNLNSEQRTDTLTSNLINFPDYVAMGFYHDMNERLAFLGTLIYTGWDSLKTIQLNNALAFTANPLNPALPGRQVLVSSTTEEHYKNAWRMALGSNYYINDAFMLRFGGGYDQTPVTDAYRDVRVPDGDRWALAIGGRYQPSPAFRFDLGYTHLFNVGNPLINRRDALGTTTVNQTTAQAHAYANLVGAQITYNMI